MPVSQPCENSIAVEEAYKEIMTLLRDKYYVQKFPLGPQMGNLNYKKERSKRNAKFKESLRWLFRLQSWEDF